MKIVLTFKEDISELMPRDVRNFCGSITPQKYNEVIMYHGRQSPPILYTKPRKYSTEIIFLKNEFFAFQALVDALEEKRNFFGRKINKVIVKDEGFQPPFFAGINSRVQYHTRTPIILQDCDFEYKMYDKKRHLNTDTENIESFVNYRIQKHLQHQLKDYLGIEQSFDNLEVNLKNHRIIMVNEECKSGSHSLAFIGNFETNYFLPTSIGYKTGIGYGQICQGHAKFHKF